MILLPIGFQQVVQKGLDPLHRRINEQAALKWTTDGAIGSAHPIAIAEEAALKWGVEGALGDSRLSTITENAALKWVVTGSVTN